MRGTGKSLGAIQKPKETRWRIKEDGCIGRKVGGQEVIAKLAVMKVRPAGDTITGRGGREGGGNQVKEASKGILNVHFFGRLKESNRREFELTT
jgi:hypothetical protein